MSLGKTRPCGSNTTRCVATALKFVVALIGAVSGSGPAVAGIDMTGKYEAVEFPCHWNFVQTGTALQVTGTCTPQAAPLSLAGTVDPDTGAFTVTGQVTGVCAATTITGTADGEMFSGHYTCDSGSGSVTGTKCLNGIIDPGEDCQDGNVLDGDCCSSRCRFESVGTQCTSDGNTCTDDVCDGAGTCLHQPNTAACDDGNACTVGDVCAGGTCTSGAELGDLALAECQLTAALGQPLCDNDPIPPLVDRALRAKLEAADAAIGSAVTTSGRKGQRLRKHAVGALHAARVRAARAVKAERVTRRVSPSCAAKIADLTNQLSQEIMTQ